MTWHEGVSVAAADLDALLAGCGPVRTVVKPNTVTGWVETGSELSYQTPVPAAGWFDEHPPQTGQTSPRPESVLRAMWSGARALWVSPNAGPDAVQAARAFAKAHPDLRLQVYLWPDERGDLPRTYALASWGITQECHELDPTVVGDLLAHAPGAPGTPDQQPPAAFAGAEP